MTCTYSAKWFVRSASKSISLAFPCGPDTKQWEMVHVGWFLLSLAHIAILIAGLFSTLDGNPALHLDIF